MIDITERPLVTFALFAYNQEQYIREAVQGAFSQIYEPLEIILSDDCSSDATFKILQEMAATYNGPHRVLVRQNEINLGIAGHIDKVASLSNGSIVVMAAGDDISIPERTAILVKGFGAKREVFAVHTDFSDVSNTPAVPKKVRSKVESVFDILYRGGGVGKGATYAYRRECFFWPRPIPVGILSEDRLLPFRAALKGDVLHMQVEAVAYRKTPESLGTKIRENKMLPLQRPEHVLALKEELMAAAKSGVASRVKSATLFSLINFRASIANHELDNSKKSTYPVRAVKIAGHLLISRIMRAISNKTLDIQVK